MARRQALIEVPSDRSTVLAHGLASDAPLVGDPAVLLTGLEPADEFAYVECHESPFCNGTPSSGLGVNLEDIPSGRKDHRCRRRASSPIPCTSRIRLARRGAVAEVVAAYPRTRVVPYRANTGGSLCVNMVGYHRANAAADLGGRVTCGCG